MTQKKMPVTLQEKLGFLDEQLATPAHDKLMMWLDRNIKAIIERHMKNPEYCRKISKTWEAPLLSGPNRFVVGFIDMLVTWEKLCRASNREEDWDQVAFWFECKTSLSSVGEILRQMNLYEQHVRILYPYSAKRGFLIIQQISEEEKKIIKEQGFGVIVVPENFSNLE